MIFTRVDLPAPFSPSRAWISAGHRSRSTASFASNAPNRLLMATACSRGWPRAPSTMGDGSSIAGVVAAREVAGEVLHARCRVAPDQQLRGGRGRDRGRRLVADFGEPDRADQPVDRRAADAELGHGAGEAGALGRAADEADIGEAVGL